jgi:hypothetical protein
MVKRALRGAAFFVLLAGTLAGGALREGVTAEESLMSNRLAQEKSPYLLQHADNPVDWYPWGEAAFEKARKEDKPVFLSIGYSTCHWCHVMEEESFENPRVAQVMNEHFVSIKVDREERPDLDNIYMTAVQAMGNSGGWPLSVFLTPEGKPFFGGTYWPPEDRWGRPGFVAVLRSVAESWKESRGELLRQGENVTELIQKQAAAKTETTFSLGEETLRSAYEDLRAYFDEAHGGFGKGTKFPRSHTLSFLLRFWKRTGEKEALAMTEKTLEEMGRGGMWDHLGGGFHRYSTDASWFLPHFEKMLYDQAILAKSYLEAYQATRRESYAQAARDIFEYVLRDLRDPEGAFYSAEDADSLDSAAAAKREGAFYAWRKSEIVDLLGDERGEIFSFVYGIRPEGNVRNDPQGEFLQKNVLSRAESIERAAERFKKSSPEIAGILEESRKKLFEDRLKRPRPHRDDKILADWNGLMISSLAFASRVLEEPRYREAAEKSADFILERLLRKDGRLLHRYREGEARVLGTIEDYAFFIHGLIDLYEATFEARYLREAKRLTGEMIRLFWDEEHGGFFFTALDAEKLIARQKEIYDGAIPSGNSVAALDLLRVGRLTMEKDFERRAEQLFSAFSPFLSRSPESHPQMLIALDFALGPSREIVLAGEEKAPETGNFLRAVYSRFLPNKVVMLHPGEGEGKEAIEALAPFIKNQLPRRGKPAAYVCENYVCRFPVTRVSELEKLLS